MNLLAIETSSEACSVAVSVDGTVSDDHRVEARAHTRTLMPMIHGLLSNAGIPADELDAVVLGNGPGSFIGMRIGASVAQGIAHAAGLRIVPVSSLAALAAEAISAHGARRVVVAQDARMGEVYVGRYEADDRGLPVLLGDEQIVAVGRVDGITEGFAAAGAAWQRYPALAESHADVGLCLLPLEFPKAKELLRLASLSTGNTAGVGPADLVPAYLRTKVADAPR